MTDYPISAPHKDGVLSRVGQLWRTYQVKRHVRAESRKRNEALRELNSVQLRDIGFARDKTFDAGFW